jgi:uncharacterized protein YndB with AHSA1/START domain
MRSSSASDQSQTFSVTLRQELSASAARIWKACTDPLELSRWQADHASGVTAAGGQLVLSWPTLGISAEVAVEEVVAEQRLLVRHGSTDVAFAISEGALEVTQSGLPDPETAEGVGSSWRLSLGVLAHYLAHHEGRDRRVTWHVASARTTPAAAHVYFSDALALAAWLTQSGGVGAKNEDVRLTLAWRAEQRTLPAKLTGRVLANTPGRDLALSWQEQNQSVIALRTLPSTASASERVLALSWSRWGEPGGAGARDEQGLNDQLAAALGRLQRVLGAAGSA